MMKYTALISSRTKGFSQKYDVLTHTHHSTMNDTAFITRDKKTKIATLHINKDASWRIYQGKKDIFKDKTPLFSGTGKGAYPLSEHLNQHGCFTLEIEDKALVLSETLLPMEGGYNIRDIGGYPAADKKRVAWGRFFRSDDMAALSDADIHYLNSIPLTTVFDFRTDKEAKEAPDRLPSSVKQVIRRALAPGNVSPSELMHGKFHAYDDASDFMHTVYREMVSEQNINAVFREFFQYIQDADQLPLLFHCSAGKDRTGIATAFLLFALGVDKDLIIKDYMASNTYLAGKYTALIQNNPQLAALYSVKPDYLLTAIATMEKMHQTVENYLEKVLHVDIAAMRAKYLY